MELGLSISSMPGPLLGTNTTMSSNTPNSTMRKGTLPHFVGKEELRRLTMAFVQHLTPSRILYTTAQYLTETNIYRLPCLNSQERLSSWGF